MTGGATSPVFNTGFGTCGPMMPVNMLPHTNLPQNLPPVQYEPQPNCGIGDNNLLQLPDHIAAGMWTLSLNCSVHDSPDWDTSQCMTPQGPGKSCTVRYCGLRDPYEVQKYLICITGSQNFTRRASDGGANIHAFLQQYNKHYSQTTNSQDALTDVSIGEKG